MSTAQLTQLRNAAREIFDAALLAVDPTKVIQQAVSLDENELRIVDTIVDAQTPIYVLSIGKASVGMARALDEILGDRIRLGLITGQNPDHTFTNKWLMFAGGHPVPNSESLRAANAAFQLLEQANAEHALVLFAISGGGSAMIEWPAATDVSLADLQEANRLLVSCGATIHEINAVRRAFSAVKGGKLASRAPQSVIVTLIISDTNSGDEASVASGPSLMQPPLLPKASDIVAKYSLESKLPPAILRAVAESSEVDAPSSDTKHYVLAENRTALAAAVACAKSLNFVAEVSEQISEQPIVDGCEELLTLFASQPQPACLISGGEFSCPVRGDGRGGRNLETVLRIAIALDGNAQHTVVLSAGTDGTDGNSPAAGAIADETTLARARQLGLNAAEFLARSDSYGFFEKLGDTIETGPTGTNVRDVRVLLKASAKGCSAKGCS